MSDEIRRVSIIIPCHNDGDRLPITLAGFANQDTDLQIECLVVDDASTQNIRSICEQYDAQYYRGEWHNASAARNFGLTQANGEIIFFFDADNALQSDYVEKLARPIINDRADLVYCQRGLIGEINQLPFDFFNRRSVRLEDLRMGAQLDTACAVRRSCLPENPWDESLNRGQDWDFHLRLMESGIRYYYLPEKLWRYWLTPLKSPKQKGRDRHYHTSHAAVRRNHQLEHAGTAEVTIGLHFSSDQDEMQQQLATALVERELYSSANLHIIFDFPTVDLYENLLTPWLEQHVDSFNGLLVTFDLPEKMGRCQKIMRSLELHLQHTTTPKLVMIGFESCPYFWLQIHQPVVADDLRRIHWFSPAGERQLANPTAEVVDSENINSAIVVHNVTAKADLAAIFDQTRDYQATTKFVIFARDQASHDRLRQADFPPGCWLPAWSANRARVLNQLLTEEIDQLIIIAAQAWPRPWLIPITHNELNGAGALSGQASWTDFYTDRFAYNCTTHRVEANLLDKSGIDLLNPWLCALNPRLIHGPLFEPRLDRDWAALLIDASFRLRRQGIDTKTGQDFWVNYPTSINSYEPVKEELIARCLSLNAPWRRTAIWCWQGLWPCPTDSAGRYRRLRSWLADVWLRWREPNKRHLWRPL